MILKLPYDRQTFLEFIDSFLPSFQNEDQIIKIAGCQSVVEGKLLGQSKDLKLPVLELTHSGAGNNRVSLTRDGFKIMKDSAIYKALVVYHSQEVGDWRLSLMTMSPEVSEQGRVNLKISNPKRNSFFLGPKAKINTPKKYLISNGPVKGFEDLLSRFNVEIVTKEFFTQYRKLFEKLSEYLGKDHAFLSVAEEAGFTTENFAKKLLGQIVFLYFVQRKGWLGAKAGDHISAGDPNFMRNVFNKSNELGKNFFNEYLEPLFYDALNRKPERAGTFYRDKFEGQIPFLNGGLFEPLEKYDWADSFLHIDDELFSSNPNNPELGEGILDIFDLYNFTVDESDANDQEVSVDPEMLGKVFENLLEENLRKGKGTYYTPREIVHYTCRESLVNYLVTNHSDITEANIRSYLAQADGISHGDFEAYKKGGESFTFGQYEELDSLLKNIKIIDPACGSGAFLIGMLQEIVKLRLFLQLTPDRPPTIDEYHLRRETIESCLYGVDIDPGAIDIAKLRLWLALVVDYGLPDIEPLPNLDYKIMQGNSLLEEFEGVKFYEESEESNRVKLITFNEDRKAKIQELELKKHEYFSAINSGKKDIRGEIDKLVDWLVTDSLEKRRMELVDERNSMQHKLSQLSPISHAEYWKNATSGIVKNLKINSLLDRISDPKALRPFFLWRLYFIEAFEQGGFDVVIANPPYVSAWSMKSSDSNSRSEIKNALSEYSILVGHWDLYVAFVAKGHQLLKEGGALSYIVPNPILREKYAKESRKFLLTQMQMRSLLEFNDTNIFEGVARRTTVLVATKNNNPNNYEIMVNKNQGGNTIRPLKRIKKDGWLLQPRHSFLVDENIGGSDLVSKIEAASDKIGNFFYVNYGAQVSSKAKGIFGKSDVVSKDKKGNAKQFYEGKDIHRWKLTYRGLWLDYRPSEMYGPRDPILFEQDKIAIRMISDKKHRIAAAFDTTKRYSNHSVVLITPYALLGESTMRNDFEGYSHIAADLDLRYVLAILLSKLQTFYFKNRFATESLQGSTSHTYPASVRGLIIKNIPRDEQFPFIDLVESITKTVESVNNFNKTQAEEKILEYEKQIDQLIYHFYALTPEEITIIENSDS